MTDPLKVYLSGPDVFLLDAQELLAAKVKLVEKYGFVAVRPADIAISKRCATPDPALDPQDVSHAIYAANIAMMREADFAIHQLTPFRGPSADPGTVFELGFMTGLGKPVFAYTNSTESYIERIGTKSQLIGSSPPAWSDVLACTIENFHNRDNLMIDGAVAASSGGIVIANPKMTELYSELIGFNTCLMAAQSHFAAATAAAVGTPLPPAIPLAY